MTTGRQQSPHKARAAALSNGRTCSLKPRFSHLVIAACASPSPIHAATAAVGSGRMRSDATFVSMMNMKLRGRNLETRASGRAGEVRVRRRQGDAKHCRVNVARFRGPELWPVTAGAQDDLRFFLYRTMMPGGAQAEARLQIVVQVVTRDTRYLADLLVVGSVGRGCRMIAMRSGTRRDQPVLSPQHLA